MGTSRCEAAVISLGFSRSHWALVDAARTAALFAYQNPFSLREDSRASAAYAEKTTLPRVSVGVSWSVRVATTDRSQERFRYQVLEYEPDSLSAAHWFL